MESDVQSEILFHIQSEIDAVVDERQLFNLVREEADCYRLRAYGVDLRFNKDDGSLIE